MPRTCSVCVHDEAHSVNVALVARETYRTISDRFGLSQSALKRHAQEHIPQLLVKARDAVKTAHGIDLMGELGRCFERVNLLFDACDRWLRDADDPTRYDIGPRAEELRVTYEEHDGERTVRRKATLSELLSRVNDSEEPERAVTLVETKHADPRELVLKTTARLQPQIELLAKLIGELDDRPQVILIAPQVQTAILDALAPHPEARQDVADALGSLEAATS